jgi:hypothetical protein
MVYRGQKSADHDDLLRLWLSSRGHDDRPQVVVSHHTALAFHELAEFIPTTIHMTVPTSYRKVVPKGCMLQRGLVPAREAQELSSFRVTKPLRTLEVLSCDASFSTEHFERAVGKAMFRLKKTGVPVAQCVPAQITVHSYGHLGAQRLPSLLASISRSCSIRE